MLGVVGGSRDTPPASARQGWSSEPHAEVLHAPNGLLQGWPSHGGPAVSSQVVSRLLNTGNGSTP
jgi:hypothetical protein